MVVVRRGHLVRGAQHPAAALRLAEAVSHRPWFFIILFGWSVGLKVFGEEPAEAHATRQGAPTIPKQTRPSRRRRQRNAPVAVMRRSVASSTVPGSNTRSRRFPASPTGSGASRTFGFWFCFGEEELVFVFFGEVVG